MKRERVILVGTAACIATLAVALVLLGGQDEVSRPSSYPSRHQSADSSPGTLRGALPSHETHSASNTDVCEELRSLRGKPEAAAITMARRLASAYSPQELLECSVPGTALLLLSALRCDEIGSLDTALLASQLGEALGKPRPIGEEPQLRCLPELLGLAARLDAELQALFVSSLLLTLLQDRSQENLFKQSAQAAELLDQLEQLVTPQVLESLLEGVWSNLPRTRPGDAAKLAVLDLARRSKRIDWSAAMRLLVLSHYHAPREASLDDSYFNVFPTIASTMVARAIREGMGRPWDKLSEYLLQSRLLESTAVIPAMVLLRREQGDRTGVLTDAESDHLLRTLSALRDEVVRGDSASAYEYSQALLRLPFLDGEFFLEVAEAEMAMPMESRAGDSGSGQPGSVPVATLAAGAFNLWAVGSAAQRRAAARLFRRLCATSADADSLLGAIGGHHNRQARFLAEALGDALSDTFSRAVVEDILREAGR